MNFFLVDSRVLTGLILCRSVFQLLFFINLILATLYYRIPSVFLETDSFLCTWFPEKPFLSSPLISIYPYGLNEWGNDGHDGYII